MLSLGWHFFKTDLQLFDVGITKSNVYFHKKNLFVQYYFTLIVEPGTFFCMKVLFDLYYILWFYHVKFTFGLFIACYEISQGQSNGWHKKKLFKILHSCFLSVKKLYHIPVKLLLLHLCLGKKGPSLGPDRRKWTKNNIPFHGLHRALV